jgi:hypothetical protein
MTVDLAAQLLEFSDGTYGTKAVIYTLAGTEVDFSAIGLSATDSAHLAAIETATEALLAADARTRVISGGGGDPEDDKTQLKATAGTLTGAYCRNSSTTAKAYAKFTNALAASTTPGTTAVFHDILIPPGTAGGGNNQSMFIAFDTALTVYYATGDADTDATDVPNNEVSCTFTVAQ